MCTPEHAFGFGNSSGLAGLDVAAQLSYGFEATLDRVLSPAPPSLRGELPNVGNEMKPRMPRRISSVCRCERIIECIYTASCLPLLKTGHALVRRIVKLPKS